MIGLLAPSAICHSVLQQDTDPKVPMVIFKCVWMAHSESVWSVLLYIHSMSCKWHIFPAIQFLCCAQAPATPGLGRRRFTVWDRHNEAESSADCLLFSQRLGWCQRLWQKRFTDVYAELREVLLSQQDTQWAVKYKKRHQTKVNRRLSPVSNPHTFASYVIVEQWLDFDLITPTKETLRKALLE